MKKNIPFVLKPRNYHIFCSPATERHPSDFLAIFQQDPFIPPIILCHVWAELSFLLRGMWTHLFSEVLQSIILSSVWISDSIGVASHWLSDHEPSAHLIYNRSLISRLCSYVKSFHMIISQREVLVNSSDECANSVCFNVITKIEDFLSREKKNLN